MGRLDVAKVAAGVQTVCQPQEACKFTDRYMLAPAMLACAAKANEPDGNNYRCLRVIVAHRLPLAPASF